MANDFASVIDEARHRAFVGRAGELASFDEALRADTPRRVLFVHGPGGIGKTTLLHQFRMRAQIAGRPAVAIDGRDVDGSPESFRAAVDRAVARCSGGDAPSRDGLPGAVLMLDGYEHLGAIDAWVREEFLPSVQAGAVVVLAGRNPPSAPWRTDPGWRALVACHRLETLSGAESAELLERAGVAGSLNPHLAALGRGHPLTLALLANAAASGSVPDDLASAPDLVAALVTQVVGDVPDEAHAIGLAVCAQAWLTTEDLLRRAVGDRAPEIWDWLESRPYVSRGADGLYAHDLVRDLLDADIRRRSPDAFRRVHRIVHGYVIACLRRADGTDRWLAAHQKVYLHRRSPLGGQFWALREQGAAAVVPGRREDHQGVLEVIERFEGEQSAVLAERWLDAQPENLVVVRSPAGLVGFAFQIVYPADPSLCDADPVVRATLDAAARISPARSGEQISIARFCSGMTGHQRDPYAVLAGSVMCTIDWVSRPLAWSFMTTLDPEFWGPAMHYVALTTELTTEFADRRYSVYGIDWRRLTIERWLELLGERELSGASGPPPADMLRPAPLDRARFDQAVRAALRDLHRPDLLGAGPLMGSALAVGFDGASVERLHAMLLGGIEQMGREPRAETLCRVLDRTFVRAAPTQETAAELLDLPFSTYRRHLAKAIERLTDLLWAVEIGEIRLDVQ
ncbi:ATP-binding protein [Nonomuraea sp. M3C6]|uniref:ATP-binding protein n=1 Tax=Nonomuraea marmarensis TaxID=3351344 RepID=A0ABW7APA6_9ACTN